MSIDREIIRIGIIGAGFARTTQIPGFKNCDRAQVVAIASGRREHAEEVAREFDIPHVADDWRSLIARDDIDLVSIVTPVVMHCDMALAALDSGKAVLCEKPMAMDAEEALRMLNRARQTKLLALIDHELRFLPGRIKMRDLLRSGKIGKVAHARLILSSDSRADVGRPWNWWSDITQGGGALGALASHAIDGFRWMLGAEVSLVSANLGTHVKHRQDQKGELQPVTTDDEASLLLRFHDNDVAEDATGVVSVSTIEAGKPQHRLSVFGSEGALTIQDNELSYAAVGAGEWEAIEVETGGLAPGMRDNDWARGFTRFAQEIVAALREGRTDVPGAATFEDGYRTQLVLDAARKSNGGGKSEPLAVAGG